MSNILARYLSLAMVIHLWIPLSSSTSALCWNDLKHIFHGSAALNCLFFFFFPFCEALLSPLFCQQVLWKQHPLWFRSNDRLAAGWGPSCGEQSKARLPPGALTAWGEDALYMELSKSSSQHTGRRLAPRLTEIFSWHHQLGSCGVKFLPPALPP